MSDNLDASLENVFPDDPGTSSGSAPTWRPVEIGVRRRSAALFRRLRPRGHGGGARHAARPCRRADRLGLRRPGSAADRQRTGRRSRRGRLFSRRHGGDRRAARHRRATVETVLASCQTFDPAGMFARDLAECLCPAACRARPARPGHAALVANLELLARRDFQALKTNLRGRRGGPARHAGRDPCARPAPGDGVFRRRHRRDRRRCRGAGRPATAAGRSNSIPKRCRACWSTRSISPRCRGHAKNQAEKDFLAECLQSANWLTRSLDQRAKTILKVASEIVRQQDAFLMHGVRQLRPLNLRTVADAIGMHESTVSRVTANKYMLTPRGVFELRYFFTASIAVAGGGDAHSSEAVRDRIRQMIDEEKPADVLSDDAIVDMSEEGRHRDRPAHGRQISGRHEHSLLGAAPARKARHGQRRTLIVRRHSAGFRPSLTSRNEVTRSPPAWDGQLPACGWSVTSWPRDGKKAACDQSEKFGSKIGARDAAKLVRSRPRV